MHSLHRVHKTGGLVVVKNLPNIYGARMFSTMATSAYNECRTLGQSFQLVNLFYFLRLLILFL
jgi:hypothetical protein